MQQFPSLAAAHFALLHVLLAVLVLVSMVLGQRHAKAREAGYRLLLGIGVAGVAWVVAAIATAPLR